MKQFIIFIISVCALTACDIERLPNGSMSSESITSDPEGSTDALLNGAYAQMKTWSDVMHRCGEYAGDNMMIRGTSTNPFYEFISYSRTTNNGRLQNFWDQGYKVIAQTSNILSMVNEGISEEMDSKLGECYFLRGLMYFYMCRNFGRPYYQNPEQNLGVPIVNGTPEDVINMELPDRSTVKQTYGQAISDLEKGASLMNSENDATHASKEAAYAILSRVYLFMSGSWENPNQEYAQLAIDYANKVIDSKKYSLLGRDAFMLYNTFTPEQNSETIFAIKRVASEFSGSDHYYGVGGMYAVIGGMGWGEMYASAKYLALLNETGRNDWRADSRNIVDARANFIEPQYEDGKVEVFRFIKNVYSDGQQVNYNYVQAITSHSGSTVTCVDNDKTYTLTAIDAAQGTYTINYEDGNTYTGVLDYKMKLNRVYPMFYIIKSSREGEESHLHSPVMSRLGEIYLNRAEAQAKMGNYSAALADLNLIRERSIPGAGYSELNASTAPGRIDKERQLELAYQAERSYDVYRNGGTLTRHYPGPHNAMEEVPATDYRACYYIPQDAINSYPGTLTQNPTSN
ncbi:MAG: RagB/SusD family nutrient uptake outer membrane protein [Bacteroidales bacterium]